MMKAMQTALFLLFNFLWLGDLQLTEVVLMTFRGSQIIVSCNNTCQSHWKYVVPNASFGILSQIFLPEFPCKFEVLALFVLWAKRCWPIPEIHHNCFAVLKLKKKNKKTKQNKTKTAYWSKQFTDPCLPQAQLSGDTGWLKNVIFWDLNKHLVTEILLLWPLLSLSIYEGTSLIQLHLENNNQKYWLLVYNTSSIQCSAKIKLCKEYFKIVCLNNNYY